MPAKPLSPEQLEDAQRLKLAFATWQQEQKRLGRPHSQEAFATNLSFGQSALSQYLGGRIPLNADALADMAQQLGVDPATISPTVVAEFSASALKLTGLPAAIYAQTGSAGEPARTPAKIAHGPETVVYAGAPRQPGMAKVTAVARVGEEGFFDEERFKGDTGGWVPAFSETHTYAVRIKGDGLAPAIENGVYLLVEPGAPVHNGERVLVNFKDGRKAIRKLLYERGGDLAVMLVTGGVQHTIEAAEVESVHPIFGIIEASRWRASLGDQAPVDATYAEPDAPGRPASRYVKSQNMGAAAKPLPPKKRSA